MRVILYTRVSTTGQADRGYSLNAQMEALREHAAEKGYEVVAEVRDPGWSGTSLDRPGLHEVREMVKAGGIDLVLAQERDRFSREPAYAHILRSSYASQVDESGAGRATVGTRTR